MIKKLVISLLLAVAIACGVGFGITTAMAAEDNTSSVEVSQSANLKIAKVDLVELFPDGYTANTSIVIKDGETEIGTITADQSTTYSTFSYQNVFDKTCKFTFVPADNKVVTKLVYGHRKEYPSFSSTALEHMTAYTLTTEDKNFIKTTASLDGYNFGALELDTTHNATEADPYRFQFFNVTGLGVVCLLYEGGAYTATYDCASEKIASPASFMVGDVPFTVAYAGAFNDGFPTYNGNAGFKVQIHPAPGYVINYVILTSPEGKYIEARELTFDGLDATYDDNGNITVTGMEVGKSYEIKTNGGAEGILTGITVNYIEHEHTGIYEPSADEESHFMQCECLYRVNEQPHTFDEGEITREPTHQGYGTIKKTCTNAECGYVKEEMLAPNFADTEVSLDKELRYNGSIQFAVYTVKYKGYEVGMSNYKVVSGVARGKEPGDYTFTIGPKDGSIFVGTKDVTFTIKKALVEKPALDTKEFYFNNTVQTYNVEENDLYSVLDNSNQQTNPGSYKVRIALNNPEFSEWEDGTTDVLEYDFVINKGNYDMSAVVFKDKTVTYNGSAFSIEATNLPDGVTVSYENNGKTDAGEYDIIAKFTGDAVNYNLIADMTATLTINKIEVYAPTVDTTVFTYNGQEQTYTVAEDELYTISGATAINAGQYTVTIELKDKTNYKWDNGSSEDLEYDFIISKATYDMSGVSFVGKTVTYNGQEVEITIAGELPTGVSVAYTENKGTNAGVYNAVAKFEGDADNYELIADMTAVLTINKVVVVAPSADTSVFTYNGQEQTYTLQTNALYTISNTSATNAGNYTITVALIDKTNYQWDNGNSNDLTYSFVIAKATYDMSGVVFADKTVTYNGSAFSIEATNLPDGVTVSYENNSKTDAGEYDIIAKFTGDADNYYLIDNKTAKLIISKATYNMSAVVFENKTVTYNGSAQSILATNLPNGVSVIYENNGKTDVGTYTITAKFEGDADNYELIADMTATLTIKKVLFTFDTNTEDDASEDIIISSSNGIDPNKQLVVQLVESEKTAEKYKELIDKNQKVAVAYDVKLLKDGASVQPDGTLKFKILIPTELIGKNFSIIHIHNGNETSVIDYTVDGDYIVFESDKLSEFVFVYDMGSLVWLIIVLAIIAIFEIAFLLYLYIKNNQIVKNKKIASVYPPFIFGMFISETQLVLVIVLAVVVIALAVISILSAVKIINRKTQVSEKDNSSSTQENVAENNEEVALSACEEVAVTNEVDAKSFNYNKKSFSEKLSQCTPELLKYYNEIKNELLSYKKVKSKISSKHESFRLGRVTIAKLKVKGKSLYLFLALDPNDYKDTKYKIKDMSAVGNCKDVPTMYKINLPRRAVYAKDLIADLMKNYQQ